MHQDDAWQVVCSEYALQDRSSWQATPLESGWYFHAKNPGLGAHSFVVLSSGQHAAVTPRQSVQSVLDKLLQAK